MKAVCTGDRWLSPDRRVYYVAEASPSGAVLMQPMRSMHGAIYVEWKTLEHEDGWQYLGDTTYRSTTKRRSK